MCAAEGLQRVTADPTATGRFPVGSRAPVDSPTYRGGCRGTIGRRTRRCWQGGRPALNLALSRWARYRRQRQAPRLRRWVLTGPAPGGLRPRTRGRRRSTSALGGLGTNEEPPPLLGSSGGRYRRLLAAVAQLHVQGNTLRLVHVGDSSPCSWAEAPAIVCSMPSAAVGPLGFIASLRSAAETHSTMSPAPWRWLEGDLRPAPSVGCVFWGDIVASAPTPFTDIALCRPYSGRVLCRALLAPRLGDVHSSHQLHPAPPPPVSRVAKRPPH